MTYNILLNSSNVVGISKSIYTYKFKVGCFDIFKNAKICVSQIIVPYSWFNISNSIYNNANFSYIINGITYSFIFPDGFYSVFDINNYLEQIMVLNNHYCINNSTGKFVYFIYLYTNTTYYGNQFIVCPVIPSNTTGYTFPSGYINTSGSNYPSPQIIFNSTNYILGYTAGTYPSTTSTSINLNCISNITPNETSVNSVVIRCNLVKNDCTVPSDILDTMYINAKFGQNLTYQPTYEKWVDLQEGKYYSLVITFVDQNLNTIYFNDSNVTISLLIEQGIKEDLQPFSNAPKKVLDIKQLNYKDDIIE
jgi:hypothetical protein